MELNHYAQIGLKEIFKKDFEYKKAGVIQMGITPNGKICLSSQALDSQWKMKQEKLSPSYTTKILTNSGVHSIVRFF